MLKLVIRKKEKDFQFDLNKKPFDRINLSFEEGISSISKEQISQLISIVRILKSKPYERIRIKELEITLPEKAPEYIDLHFFNYTLIFHKGLHAEIIISYPFSGFDDMQYHAEEYFPIYAALSHKIDNWPKQVFSKSEKPYTDISNLNIRLSKSFMPAILINGNSSEEFSLDFWFNNTVEVFSLDILEEEFNQLCDSFNLKADGRKGKKDILLDESLELIRKYNWIHSTDNSFSQYALRSLSFLHVLKIHLKEFNEENRGDEDSFQRYLMRYTIKKEAFNTYARRIKPLLSELREKPRIAQFLFYFLSVRILDSKNIIYSPEQVYTLLDYVENLVFGLKELAKNVIEHTQQKIGVITIELKKSDTNVKASRKLKITVSDTGNYGIVEKAIKDLKEKLILLESNNRYKSIFKKDIRFLESTEKRGEALYSSYFDINQTSLESQFIKTAASYGLMIFSNVVFDQDGVIMISSQNLIGNETNYTVEVGRSFHTVKETSKYHYGTHFEISIPIQLNSLEFKSDLTFEPRIVPNSESAFMKVLSIQNLGASLPFFADPKYMYGMVEFDIGPIYDESTRSQSDTLGSSSEKLRISEKLKGMVTSKISELKEYPNHVIVCLDFSNSSKSLDSSIVCRLLSYLQTEKAYKYVVLNHLDENIASELIELLYMLEGKSSKTRLNYQNKFWNPDHYVLIVSGTPVYSLCMLNGSSSDEFEYINSLILRTHRTMPWLKGYQGTFKEKENKKKKSIGKTPFFSQSGFFTPMELILSIGNETIFENLVQDKLQMLMD